MTQRKVNNPSRKIRVDGNGVHGPEGDPLVPSDEEMKDSNVVEVRSPGGEMPHIEVTLPECDLRDSVGWTG